MEFWLSFNNSQEKLRLPVPPSSFEVKTGLSNQKINVLEVGEINLIGKKTLDAVSITSFFPAQAYSFCQYKTFPVPYDCVNLIEKWKASGKPIRIIITGTNVNKAVAIDSFSYGERDASGDVHFTLDLSEYVFLTVEKSGGSSTAKNTSNPNRPTNKTTPKTVTVKAGDTLLGIAKKYYNDSSKWVDIKKNNGIKNEKALAVGTVLKL